MSAGSQIVQSVTITVAASPLIIDVVEATARVEWKLFSLLKTVAFAEWRAEPGNLLQLVVQFFGGIRVSTTLADLCMFRVFAGV